MDYRALIGLIFFLIIWIGLYLYRKPLRKEMLIMSLLCAPLGPLSEIFYFRDYWHPEYLIKIFGFGLEDLLFAFFIGGIAAIIYEEFFIKKIKKPKRNNSKSIAILFFIGLISLLIFNIILKFNSIYVSSFIFLGLGIIIIFKRKDLLKNAIWSGILIAGVMLLFYFIYNLIFPEIIQDWWKLGIEELLWGFCWGFLSGPIYEYWRGIKQK